MAKDLRKELEELEEEYPPAWHPEPGEILVGTIRRYDEGRTPYGQVRTVIIQDEETGERVSLWISGAVIRNEFDRLRPEPGERVGIRYLGKDQQKGYHKYKMRVDRDANSAGAVGGTLGTA